MNGFDFHHQRVHMRRIFLNAYADNFGFSSCESDRPPFPPHSDMNVRDAFTAFREARYLSCLLVLENARFWKGEGEGSLLSHIPTYFTVKLLVSAIGGTVLSI